MAGQRGASERSNLGENVSSTVDRSNGECLVFPARRGRSYRILRS